MSETLKNHPSENTAFSSIKENFSLVVEKALSNKKLNKKERSEILNLLEEINKAKEKIKDETRQKLESFLKEAKGGTDFERQKKLILQKIEENKKVVESTEKPEQTEASKQEEPKQEEPKQEEPKQEEPKQTALELNEQNADQIKQKVDDSISKIESILENGIQTGDERKLTEIIKDLQNSKILKNIPGIKNGQVEEGIDLEKLGKDVIVRLKKISDRVEKFKDNKKTETERKFNEKVEKERAEISEFKDGLLKIDTTDIVNRINSSIDALKDNLKQQGDSLEDSIQFDEQKVQLKSKLDKIKLSSDNKTIDDLLGSAKIEKDDKGNLKLKFTIDPKGFDDFDSKKIYIVELSSLKLDEQKSNILSRIEKAYSEQISNLTKDLLDNKQ